MPMLKVVADKAREMSKQIKSMEEQLKNKDVLNQRAATLLRQERDEHNQTKDKLVKMAEKAKQILAKPGGADGAKSELSNMLGESHDVAEIKVKHKQETTKLADELEKERKLRQETERENSELDNSLQQFIIENQMLKETIEEQKGLIARLENGLNLAMDQLDYVNALNENGGGGGMSGGGVDNYDLAGEFNAGDDGLDVLDSDTLEDPEMVQMLAEMLMNNRKSMDFGDLGDLFQKMDG